MSNKILVFLEQRNGQIKKSSFEVASKGLEIATKLNYEISFVTIGSEISNSSDLKEFGVSELVHLKNSNLSEYSSSAYTQLLKNFALENKATILLFSNTAMGKDLSPRLAVKLNAGVMSDLIALEISGTELIGTRPIYAGKALEEIKLVSDFKVLTLRPNVFKAEKRETASFSVNLKEIAEVDLSTKVVEIKKSSGKIDVAEADIIVSGGRGLKGPENFPLVEQLAEVLGAAVGASRAVVDAGWRSHSEQVGQTGKTVSPTLYFALGISGAIQHLAGMSSSKYIVAINKDKDAPIFSIADYGIVGDVLEILPVLTEEIKKIKS